jgi:hypothetical protein
VLTVVPPVENVLPFRASTPEKSPSLTPVERKAFRELASRLTARLREAQSGAVNGTEPDLSELAALQPDAPPPPAEPPAKAAAEAREDGERQITSDQRPILDRLPLGMLVYRLDRLLYANRAFLDWTGYESIHALADAGVLDALFIEPGTDTLGQNGAKSLAITTSHGSQVPIEARLSSRPRRVMAPAVAIVPRCCSALHSMAGSKAASCATQCSTARCVITSDSPNGACSSRRSKLQLAVRSTWKRRSCSAATTGCAATRCVIREAKLARC